MNETKTPLTDAAILRFTLPDPLHGQQVVNADFARSLEQKLAEMEQERDHEKVRADALECAERVSEEDYQNAQAQVVGLRRGLERIANMKTHVCGAAEEIARDTLDSSSPPPDVVPREVAEALAEAIENRAVHPPTCAVHDPFVDDDNRCCTCGRQEAAAKALATYEATKAK